MTTVHGWRDTAPRVRELLCPGGTFFLVLAGGCCALASAAETAATRTLGADCDVEYREHVKAGVLELDLNAFDQDLDGGWRTLAQAGCHAAAGALIDEYIDGHPELTREDLVIVNFHSGQMHAFAGDPTTAIDRFVLAVRPDQLLTRLEEADEAELAQMLRGWNLYVEATLSFLRGDREALAGRYALLQRHDDQVSRTNTQVVARLLKHFGSSYAEAYTGGER